MGFHLVGIFAIDDAVLTLYERVLPRGARLALRTRGEGLPPGWVLPWPALAEWVGGTVEETPGWAEHEHEWRAAAGMPDDPVFEDAFDAYDVQLASLLSLAAPAGVVIMDDQTHGGVLGREFAAVCVAGRLVAASGIDFLENRAYSLEDGRFEPVDRASVSPVADCAAVLDPAFTGAFLFGGYLPRNPYEVLNGGPADPDAGPHHPLRIPDRVRDEWSRFFPLLAD